MRAFTTIALTTALFLTLPACATDAAQADLTPIRPPAPIFAQAAAPRPTPPTLRLPPPPPPPALEPQVDARLLSMALSAAVPAPSPKACTGDVCGIPDIGAPLLTPAALERSPAELIPAGGTLDLVPVGGWTLFGRTWKRNQDLGGLGLGLSRTLHHQWQVGCEVGFDPRVALGRGGMAVATSLQARF